MTRSDQTYSLKGVFIYQLKGVFIYQLKGVFIYQFNNVISSDPRYTKAKHPAECEERKQSSSRSDYNDMRRSRNMSLHHKRG